MAQRTIRKKKSIKMQNTAVSRYNDAYPLHHHSFRASMRRLFKDNIFRKKSPKPAKPLISPNSNNVFHDQALMQLASAYESLQLGDSPEATAMAYSTGVRIFGRDWFERAVQDRGRRTYSQP